MKQVTFIHGADIHLDSPMVGLRSLPERIFKRLQESTFHAFQQLIHYALAYQVDFVILAGDLFDHEDRSVRAQAFLRREMERLAKAGIDVYLVHGNHDFLTDKKSLMKLPENVHVFGSRVEVKSFNQDDTTVHLYGFSYPERHVFERKVNEYRKKQDGDFHIGILHGNLEGSAEHGNYAPFQLKELLAKDFDYWALGHIHKRAILHESPPIIYPGNTQGRNKKEQGEKGCYFVTLNEAGAKLHFLETNDVIWTELRIDGSNLTSFDEVYQGLKDEMSRIRKENKGQLVQIEINQLSANIEQEKMEELLELLQEEEQLEHSFVWPIKLKIRDQVSWKKEELRQDSDFYGELFSIIDQDEAIEEALSSLFQHHRARRYLDPLTPLEEEELKADAEKLLIERLLRG